MTADKLGLRLEPRPRAGTGPPDVRARIVETVKYSGADILTRRSCNMMRPRHHFTLIDLMAAVGAAALGLGWVVSVAPGRAGPALVVIGPLIGILCHRWRGGRGILGGTLGGTAYAGFGLIMLVTGPHRPGGAALSSMADWPVQVVIMTAICLTFGTLMGVAAWLAAAAMGRSVAPTLPSPNDRFVRKV
jgi:hypothetical protein